MQGGTEEGCDEFYPLEIYCVVAQLNLAIFVPNAKKAGYKKKIVVGAVAQIPSMAKKRGRPRKVEKKNKEEEKEKDTISSVDNKQ